MCGYVACVLECRGSNVWLRGLCAGVSWFQCVVTWPVCWSVVVPMCGYVACALECRGSNVWLHGLCAGVSGFQGVVRWRLCWSFVVPSVVVPSAARNHNNHLPLFRVALTFPLSSILFFKIHFNIIIYVSLVFIYARFILLCSTVQQVCAT
jgi:hypothetical protein